MFSPRRPPPSSRHEAASPHDAMRRGSLSVCAKIHGLCTYFWCACIFDTHFWLRFFVSFLVQLCSSFVSLACWRYGAREAVEMRAVCVVLDLVIWCSYARPWCHCHRQWRDQHRCNHHRHRHHLSHNLTRTRLLEVERLLVRRLVLDLGHDQYYCYYHYYYYYCIITLLNIIAIIAPARSGTSPRPSART